MVGVDRRVTTRDALLDAGTTIKGWVRTGQSFRVSVTAPAGSSPVCRFGIPPSLGNSHFYGRGTHECNATRDANPTIVNEDPQLFHMTLPVQGTCPPGTRNVYRVFSGARMPIIATWSMRAFAPRWSARGGSRRATASISS